MSSDDGMIPRALHQIYETAQNLQEKGWRYTMEGSFVEVYNENLNDLLGRAEDFDKKKHEIRHDMQRCKTHVSDLTTVLLDSPAKVECILRQASANRSVAATKANERSSRSHSVFILRMTGENDITGERSEGTLNLVDLAGSERLSQSGSTGDRLKETQNINRSLSCLGDVIGALGQGKEGGHVPYRNSKVKASPSPCSHINCCKRARKSSYNPLTMNQHHHDGMTFIVDISPPILARRKLQNAHVRHDQSPTGSSERDVDQFEVRYKGMLPLLFLLCPFLPAPLVT